MEKALHKISVRALSERIYRSGSLLGAGYGGVSGQTGTRVHQRVFKDLKKQYDAEEITTEYPLSINREYELFCVQLSGRADCIIEQDQVTIFEIKTHNKVAEKVESLILPTHEAQVKIYAHLYFNTHPQLQELTIVLRYVSAITYQFLEKSNVITRQEASDFFEDTIALYLSEAQRICDYEHTRERVDRRAVFPL